MISFQQLQITSHMPDKFNVRNMDEGVFVAENITREELCTWWLTNAANYLQRALTSADEHIVAHLPEL